MSATGGLKVVEGWCEPEVARELPQLRLIASEVRLGGKASPLGSSSGAVRDRLAELSNRFNGAKAIHLRGEQVPSAYRVFFHQIGLDPDVMYTPIEGAILERMLDGGFRSKGLLRDALLIAMVDTSVPVWAVDADTLDGSLGIRRSRPDEPLAAGGGLAPAGGGRLVVADCSAPVSTLFGEPLDGHRAHWRTRRLMLYALQVGSVPWLTVQEALWISREMLKAAR